MNRKLLFATTFLGGAAVVYLSNKATLEASDVLKDPKLSAKEKVKRSFRYYIPAFITGIATVGCAFIGFVSDGVSIRNLTKSIEAEEFIRSRKNEETNKYREEVKRHIGKQKEVEVWQSSKSRLMRLPEKEIETSFHGNTLFYDVLFGRYFRSDIEYIKLTVNKLNAEMMAYGQNIPVNEFYSELGLAKLQHANGSLLGFDHTKGIHISLSSCTAFNGEPCVLINYELAPIYIL